MIEHDLPNKYIVKTLDEHTDSLRRIEDKLDRKVGRTELIGWLGATATLVGVCVLI